MREITPAPQDRPAGLLSPALAGPASAGRHVCGLRGASRRGQDTFLWREQFRCAGSRRCCGDCRRGDHRLQSSALSLAGTRHRTHRVTWCEQHGLAVTAYSPLGHGEFPSKHTPAGRVLAEIAEAHHATPRQIALAFLTLRPSVFAIPKASSVAHVEENAGASRLLLSSAEIARIDAAFPRGPRRALPML